MAKQVRWCKKTFDDFCEYGMLNSDEIYILKSRIEGVPISEQAYYLNVSPSTVDRMISKMKKKYDHVQRLYPELFPPRKFSVKETWMDNN